MNKPNTHWNRGVHSTEITCLLAKPYIPQWPCMHKGNTLWMEQFKRRKVPALTPKWDICFFLLHKAFKASCSSLKFDIVTLKVTSLPLLYTHKVFRMLSFNFVSQSIHDVFITTSYAWWQIKTQQGFIQRNLIVRFHRTFSLIIVDFCFVTFPQFFSFSAFCRLWYARIF